MSYPSLHMYKKYWKNVGTEFTQVSCTLDFLFLSPSSGFDAPYEMTSLITFLEHLYFLFFIYFHNHGLFTRIVDSQLNRIVPFSRSRMITNSFPLYTPYLFIHAYIY